MVQVVRLGIGETLGTKKKQTNACCHCVGGTVWITHLLHGKPTGPGLPERRFFKFGGLIIHLTSLTGERRGYIEWEMVQADFGGSTYLQLCKFVNIYLYGKNNRIDLDIYIYIDIFVHRMILALVIAGAVWKRIIKLKLFV